MKKTHLPLTQRIGSAIAAAFLALAAPLAPAAEDVDIFGGLPGTGALPNVLVVIDSSVNWSATLGKNDCNAGNTADDTKFAAEVCALQIVLDKLEQSSLGDKIRLGLMLFTESGDNGAYVRFGVRQMNQTNRDAMRKMLKELNRSAGGGGDGAGSNQPVAKALFEAFKYFGGGGTALQPQGQLGFGPVTFTGGFNNNSGSYRRDYAGNKQAADRAADYYEAEAPFPLSGKNSNEYTLPPMESCTKNFVIFIGNGNPSPQGGDSSTQPGTAATIFKNIGGNLSDRIMNGGAEWHPSLLDEMARHLFKNIDLMPGAEGQQKLITYTLAVYQPQKLVPLTISNSDRELIKLMRSTGENGGGSYFAATSAQAIVDAMMNILNQVQAVNSVFVSASLPVSVNTQGTFLNQVYMGLFRPEPNPRWYGNVKQYKFALDSATGEIRLVDSTGQRAVNPATGFVTPGAVSFWTQDSAFWSNDTKGIPPSKSDSPDGDVVEKGGAAYVQRRELDKTQDGRQLFTCVGGCTDNLSLVGAGNALSNANIVGSAYESAFGVVNKDELSLLVNWIRGADNAGGAKLVPFAMGTEPCDTVNDATCTWFTGEKGPGWPTTVRASVQGDVLHSRPVVLNYCANATACPGVTNFSPASGPYMFYGSNDGFLRAVKGGQELTDGKEIWAFVAPEFFGKFRRLRYNYPPWLNPGTPDLLLPIAKTKDYFFDGPIGSWEDQTTSPPTKWIFVTARRGGRLIYAFDVSDPEKPILKWKKTSVDLPKLGQTWSLPVAFKNTGVAYPYLVFGAGYDPGEDQDPPVSNDIGRGIYVLNANTGEELAFINTGVTRPIASDMAFLAKPAVSGVGDVYRGYVGDLDGNVFRLDISGAPTDWKLYLFASLGTGQKFLYAPDLVKAGDRDMILLGSGDREKPLVTTSTDRFYGLSDFDNDPAPLPAAPAVITFGMLTPIAGESVIPTACATCKGWYRAMAPGEKVVNSPLTVAGITYFATNKPVPTPVGACQTNLGEARAYGVSFLTGGKPATTGSVSTVLTGGGLPPSPVGGVVDMGDGKLVTFVIGSGKDGSRLEPERPPLNVPSTRTKIYWNVKSDS